ncbi:MAG: class I SAM-dependent methyltransferase [archaeon]
MNVASGTDNVSLLQKALRYSILDLILTPIMISKIRKLKQNLSLEEYSDFCLSDPHKMIYPLQVKEEILLLLQMLEKNPPKNILEIGTSRGGTLFLFSRIAAKNATLISIDKPGWIIGNGYPPWRIPLYKSFRKDNQKICLIRKYSGKQTTSNEVKKLFDGKIDFLFIDGDHSYPAVKRDFDLYSRLVKKGGIIALHDIIRKDPECCDVNRFWKKIKEKYKHKEIVSKDQNTGIGILFF